jgi:hypothetical protein
MTSSARIAPEPADAPRSSSTWSWLLPVLTFLLGCLLGGVVIAAGASGDVEEVAAAPEATTAPGEAGAEDGTADETETEPESEDVEVQVPESCLAAADGAVVAANRIDNVVEAVRDLDAQRLQELVDEVQEQQPRVRELAERCRSTAGERLEDAELTPTEPSASPSS